MTADRHPMQPIALDEHGVPRFKANKIIEWLFDTQRPLDLNAVACIEFPTEDREQLAQLLGYSIGGYAELSYVTDESYDEASAIADRLAETPKESAS